MRDNLILVAKDDKTIRSDFWIARYPVTIREFEEIVEKKSGNQSDANRIKEATWMEAIRYCNSLNRKQGLPLSYDETTGELLDEHGNPVEEVLEVTGFRFPTSEVKGFRLPTCEEWEYAAKGGSARVSSGSYVKILQTIYTDWYIDTQCREIDRMKMNTIGLFGMLENREWYSDNKTLEGLKNRMCCWEEYFYNYNNDLAYQVIRKTVNDMELNGFRVV
ncbi:MAG: SUMF1/EgtB/PvdO family nonheme iron enzyme, partial [Candidatus Competibacter sp.]|nr:SUMF1/EgtB/PvdO family nonheme iron enzyme [Candidatus Competibacter sp.]